MRTLLELPCLVLHRMWWVPAWSRSVFLSCPIAWACSRFPAFDDWYWEHR